MAEQKHGQPVLRLEVADHGGEAIGGPGFQLDVREARGGANDVTAGLQLMFEQDVVRDCPRGVVEGDSGSGAFHAAAEQGVNDAEVAPPVRFIRRDR